MMVVSCEPTKAKDGERWNVKALEDHAATACAVQNFMLSLASEGYGWSLRVLSSFKKVVMTNPRTHSRRLQVDDWQDGNLGRQDHVGGSRRRHWNRRCFRV